MAIKLDREAKGKSLKNMTYSAAFNEVCNIIAEICPCAYRIFQHHFGGRTFRSIRCVLLLMIHLVWQLTCSFNRSIRSHLPKFQLGISDFNIKSVANHLQKLCCTGPLGLAHDNTKLEKALQAYRDAKENWFILGGVGDPLLVESVDELERLIQDAEAARADKVWLGLSHYGDLISLIL